MKPNIKMDCKVLSEKSSNGNFNFRQIATPIAEKL